jgi:CelD/BcsL family acetyltransferase involved in cellulose biosynthesis
MRLRLETITVAQSLETTRIPMQPDTTEIEIELVGTPAACEELWRAFETTAIFTPYQRYDWIATWREAMAPREETATAVVLLRLRAELIAILPLGIRTHAGVTIASILGGRHVNFQMPVWSPLFLTDLTTRLDGARLEALLRRIGEALGVDAMSFEHQPGQWNRTDNPLSCVRVELARSPAFILPLAANFESIARARRSARSLQQIRRKRRRLEAIAGPLAFARGRDAETCERVVDKAIADRARRRRTSGVPSFFDVEGGAHFIRKAALLGLNQPDDNCVLAVHYLQAGDTVVASYFGGSAGGHYSCFANAFDVAFEKYSPGDIILHDLIKHLCEQGLRGMDLGVGEEHYKKLWCDMLPLHAGTLPITALGALYSGGARSYRAAKQAVKKSDLLWNSWRAARKLRA